MVKEELPEALKAKMANFLKEKNKEWAKVGMTYPLTVDSFENDIVALAFLEQAKPSKK